MRASSRLHLRIGFLVRTILQNRSCQKAYSCSGLGFLMIGGHDERQAGVEVRVFRAQNDDVAEVVLKVHVRIYVHFAVSC